ncbi:hypothetical protein F2981_02485 [Sinorhizobium meliloti]|nr:hypothetical protein [Sinorhizobium meliloti]
MLVSAKREKVVAVLASLITNAPSAGQRAHRRDREEAKVIGLSTFAMERQSAVQDILTAAQRDRPGDRQSIRQCPGTDQRICLQSFPRSWRRTRAHPRRRNGLCQR